MKNKTLVSILIFVLSILLITGRYATTLKAQAREDVNQEIFFQSVGSGDIAEVKRLIEKGADVNVQSEQGLTALMYASQYGQLGVCNLLIESRADVNERNDAGQTALTLAEREWHTEVAKLLKEAGAKE